MKIYDTKLLNKNYKLQKMKIANLFDLLYIGNFFQFYSQICIKQLKGQKLAITLIFIRINCIAYFFRVRSKRDATTQPTT
jgi:hypothetical protein